MSLENLFCKNTGKTLTALSVMAVNLFTGCGYNENAQVHSKVDLGITKKAPGTQCFRDLSRHLDEPPEFNIK